MGRELGQTASRRSCPFSLSGLLVLCGLSLGAWPFTAAAGELEKVRVGIAQTLSDSGYYIAEHKGYFRQEGIELAMTPFNSAAAMVAPLGTGELDVGGGTVSAGLYNADARGFNLKIVADQASMRPGYVYSSLLVRKDIVDGGRYKAFADLKGMKVAIGAPGTGTASALNEALKKGGLKYNDVDVVYLGFPNHLAAYRNKGIEASISNEPTMTLMLEEGVAVRVAGNDVIYPDQQTAVVFYSANFVKNRRSVAEGFMRAYIRGIRDYNGALKDGRIAGPSAAEIIAILTQYTTIKNAALYSRLIPSAVDPDGRVNLAGLKNDLAFFREQGLVTNDKVTVEDVYDGSFVAAALKVLGPYQANAKR
jgi:NitT/TauT family transport system substrate-binding protein